MVSKKKLFITMIYALTSMVLYLALAQFSQDMNRPAIQIAGWIIMGQAINTALTYYWLGIPLLSFSGIFTWLMYLFHLSQPVLIALFPDYSLDFDVSKYVLATTYFEAIKYSFMVLFFLAIGVLIMQSYRRKDLQNSSLIQNHSELAELIKAHNLFKTGLFIFILTFPFEIYLQISRLFVALNEGYLATFNFELGGFFGILANISLVGMIMMLCGQKHNQKVGRWMLLAYTLFYLIAMFSGGRMWQVIKLLLVFTYYLQIYQIKISKKNLILLLIGGYLLAGFLSVIADIRSYDFTSSGYILEIAKNIFAQNPILKVLDEFGGTIYTLTLTIDKVPAMIERSWGSQFILNFASLLPNLTGKIDEMVNETNFVLLLKMPHIGGSLVAELYYSFGKYQPIFSLLLGMGIQAMTQKIRWDIQHNQYRFITYTALLQYSLISWIRGSSSILYRNTFYGSLFVLVVVTYMSILKKKEVQPSWRRS
ncbi:O-antigen polysaccharide polymerase Wzy [Ignavigranum ruoffiae]|uniref:O-antigen polysaccharide polymerase Wzy n=1 Tax=Ignavigranum ruoffiae TaxID=89093 RepID=A0A1H9CR29_9LACT|nr:O-antigen polysaccharide polymerase Wzy [Ignavigranum ruoffiae]UPQ86657.1 O-antigen polysaccharide polymerase Wzy family protein [Ignavigranum ruoffiae]SEQ03068.1 O-antigen polysaccharide polymerase Wzy [Ignavigranum ruoffiae]